MRRKVHFDFNHHKEVKMNDLRERYFNMQCSLFPMVEEEFGELTSKMKEFLRIVELVQPGRFINAALRWCGYKLHLILGDGGVPLATILTSASPHDSQVAIPLMQITYERAKVLYDLADSAYDAPEIHAFSKSLGHVPVIDPNKRRGDKIELDPAKKIRYRERTTVERGNSELKDNYGARHVRVKGHLKVFCHLMFGVIAVTVKQLFNMLC